MDLLNLSDLDAAFGLLRERYNEEAVEIDELVMCCLRLFEAAQRRFPALLRSVPLAVDLAINLMLNIFDP